MRKMYIVKHRDLGGFMMDMDMLQMTDLKRILIQDRIFSCFQLLIVNFAAINNRDYHLTFPNSWGFYLNDKKHDTDSLGSRLSTGWSGSFDEIRINTGIAIKSYDTKNLEAVLDVMEKYSDKDTMWIIMTDSFWCPWSLGYQKQHMNHCILII